MKPLEQTWDRETLEANYKALSEKIYDIREIAKPSTTGIKRANQRLEEIAEICKR